MKRIICMVMAVFAADEARAQLTWKGRFKDVLDNRGVEVYNFYSAGDGTQSGDEVFELAEMTPRPTSGLGWVWWNPIRPLVDIVSDNVILGRHSWQKQECWKGRGDVSLFAFMASDKMGWGFEEPQKTNEDTEKMSDEDFRRRKCQMKISERVPSSVAIHRQSLAMMRNRFWSNVIFFYLPQSRR